MTFFNQNQFTKNLNYPLYKLMRIFPLSYDIHYLMQRYKTENKMKLANEYDTIKTTYLTLYHYGFGDLVLEELDYLNQVNPTKTAYKLTMAKVQTKLKQYNKAVVGMSSEFFDKRQRVLITDETLPTIFPKSFWPIVKRYSNKYNVDPYLALAIMPLQHY